jgi:hypothetical protein
MKKTNPVRVLAYWMIVIVSAISIFLLYIFFQENKKVPAKSVEEIIKDAPEQKPTETIDPTEVPAIKKPDSTAIKALPPELNIYAPFYSQAPFSNWDFPWQEACEEASILLAANVYGKHNWTRTEFNDEILKMVEWQKKEFGTYLDTTAAQNAKIFNDYLGIKTVMHENPSLEDVKTILNKWHFVIIFLAGKELNNPNFTNGGPVYHVILVKGYKGTNIITHDVGTKNGADYIYSWATLQSAMHDFAVPIDSGAKRILEVLP